MDDTVHWILQAKILQVGKIPCRRERLPTLVFWPREFHGLYCPWGSQRVRHAWATFTAQTVKCLSLQCGRPGFDPWVGKIHWRRKWQPTPVFMSVKFHGLRSLVGYSPWGHKELDTTEQLHFHFEIAQLHMLLPSFLFKNSMVSYDIIGELNKGPVECGEIQKEHGWGLYWDHIVYHRVWSLSNK